jgi:DNA-binding NtrC family response regulator
VWFPLPARSDVVEFKPAVGHVSDWKGSGTILLVDDEGALRIIGSTLLSAMGFSVLTAANGREALDIHHERGNGIDLVLLNLFMPEMGGVETYRELRSVSPYLPIVICSGYAVEEVLVEIMKDERAGVIQKPYKADQLQEVLMKVLSSGSQS